VSDDVAGSVTGAVLVGGRSLRMGRDKAALLVDGRPLAGRVAGALGTLGGEVILAGRAVAGLSLRVVEDALVPGGPAGPLAGIVAALQATVTPYLVVAACDMPSIHPALVRHLVERLAGQPQAGAVVCRSDIRLEPFPLALRVAEAQPVLRVALEEGVRALHQALGRLHLVVLDHDEWGAVDPDGASFVNWNSPEDVRQPPATEPTMPPP